MKKNILTFAILVAIISGCAPKPTPAPEPTADLNSVVGTMMAATLTAVAPTPVPPTETPAPTPLPTDLPPGTLVEEFGPGFDLTKSGYAAPYDATDPTGQVKHNFTVAAADDMLQMDLPDAETYPYIFYDKEMPADVVIETSYKITGSKSSESAVVCRVDPSTRLSWYEFRVNHYERSGIIYFFNRVDPVNNPYNRLAYAKLPVELFTDKANRMQAICKGNTLTLSVNGEKVISVEDTKLTGAGLVGFAGFVHKQIPINISFNNFKVVPANQ
jgi:hypothetical protein